MSQAASHLTTHPQRGAAKAAALLRALGPDAEAVWAVLTPEEARLISGEMQHLPPENPGSAERTLAALLNRGDRSVEPTHCVSTSMVWERLEAVPPRRLADFLASESPQTAAIILSRLAPSLAGAVVRALPEETALAILHRMVALSPPSSTVLAAIEAGLERFLGGTTGGSGDGVLRVAEVFEAIGDAANGALLDAFSATSQAAASEVRQLMVPFTDIAGFPAAGIQTLLANLNQDTLALALKGAPETLQTAVFSNMTQRAATILREDMEALGPVPQRDVNAARALVVSMVRDLVRKGEVRLQIDAHDGDLVE